MPTTRPVYTVHWVIRSLDDFEYMVMFIFTIWEFASYTFLSIAYIYVLFQFFYWRATTLNVDIWNNLMAAAYQLDRIL